MRTLEQSLVELREKHVTRSPADVADLKRLSHLGLPADVLAFYATTDGASMRPLTEEQQAKIVAPWQWTIPEARSLHTLAEVGFGDPFEPFPDLATWYAVADLRDSNHLGIETVPPYTGRIIDCDHEFPGYPNTNPIVALSFTELLDRLLDHQQRFWDSSNPPYGFR